MPWGELLKSTLSALKYSDSLVHIIEETLKCNSQNHLKQIELYFFIFKFSKGQPSNKHYGNIGNKNIFHSWLPL